MPSHYARKEIRKLYLEPVYRTLTDVFNVYKQLCREINTPAVSRYTFDKTFNNTHFCIIYPQKRYVRYLCWLLGR